jgi:uncharacterized membrane protein YeaQ/YmgE (transglycosylase-associated protein family)
MRGIIRLIQELQAGNPRAVYVLLFAIVGAVVLVVVAGRVRARRSRQNNPKR